MTLGFQMHVTIPYFSNIPDDVVTNVWSFTYVTLSPADANWADLVTRLTDFYEDVYDTTGVLGNQWCQYGSTRWKGYDLSDPLPRAPKYDVVSAISAAVSSGSKCTPETAVCLSFQGTQISGSAQARRRGRIFIGAMGDPMTSGSTTAFPTLGSSKRSVIATAASNLLTGAAIDGWTWSVYSRADDVMVPVNNGWIDDAPDTQRRRGQAATTRTTWS